MSEAAETVELEWKEGRREGGREERMGTPAGVLLLQLLLVEEEEPKSCVG